MKIYITLLLMVFLLVVAFIFGSQNSQIFTLNYLIARTEISVAAAVSLFTSIGFFLGLFFALFWRFVRAIKPKSTVHSPKG